MKGVANRFNAYDRVDRTLMPKYVLEALDDGYAITSKGLLVWCRVPSSGLQLTIRALFHVLEATFSFAFWTMRVTKRLGDYGMASMCL